MKKYENIKNFLEEKLKEYYFSNEGASDNYKKLEGIEKYLVYKTVARKIRFTKEEKFALFDEVYEKWQIIKKFYTGIKDPDSNSKLLQDIYSVLWDIEEKDIRRKDGGTIQGETLNSVQTTLDKMYELYERPEHKKQRFYENPEHKKQQQKISIKYMVSRYCADGSDRENFSFLGKEFESFIRVYHTLGNFMPIPDGCNCEGAVKDYWDLKLWCIYKYYHESSDEWIKNLVGEDDEKVKKYEKWLDAFKSWNNFVEKNYLEAFVNENDKNKPKSLWGNHIDNWIKDKQILPKKESECAEYFKNAAECIKKRTDAMIKELKNKINMGKSLVVFKKSKQGRSRSGDMGICRHCE